MAISRLLDITESWLRGAFLYVAKIRQAGRARVIDGGVMTPLALENF